jgi:hypothetical protein
VSLSQEQAAGRVVRGLLYYMSDNSTLPAKIQKRSFTVLRNKHTGQVLEIDTALARVQRLRLRVGSWATFMRSFAMKGCQMKMITLTYAPGAAGPAGEFVSQWRPTHITQFISKVKKHCGSKLRGYAWVAELQDRGEVHYHVLLVVRSGSSLPYPDKAGWWVHGMSRIEIAHSPGYVVKYAQKADEDTFFPKGLRLYSVWVAKDLRGLEYDKSLHATALPAWLRINVPFYEAWPKPKLGGGWIIKLLGMGAVVMSSPYIFVTVAYLARPG